MATPTSGVTDSIEHHRKTLGITTLVTTEDAALADSLQTVTSGYTKVAFFVDANLLSTPYVRDAIGNLPAAIISGIQTDIQENPTEAAVMSAAAFLKPLDADCVVAIGGGSTIDTAKMGLLLAFGGGVPKDWWPMHRHDAVDAPPLFVYPTTAGTGSEVQSHALVSDDITHRKMAIGHARLAPTQAILDVALLSSCPRKVMVLAGIDALSHALESAVTRTATCESTAAACDAFAMLWPALLELSSGTVSETSAQMLHVGATLAGMAIEASMLGAAHGCGNPLTAKFGVVHGQAVSVMLPAVVALNEHDPKSAETYRLLEQRCGIEPESLPTTIRCLVENLGLASSLSTIGINDPPIEQLATLAMEQWTCGHNPVPMTQQRCIDLYNAVA